MSGTVILDLQLTTTPTTDNPVVGDLELVDGDLVWLTDPDDRVVAIAQDVRSRLLMLRGDYFLDRNLGIPYLQEILGARSPDLASLQSLFAGVVEETAGIDSVVSVTLSLDAPTRALSIDWIATTDSDPNFTIRESVSLLVG